MAKIFIYAFLSLVLSGVSHSAPTSQPSSGQTASPDATPPPPREQDLRVAALTAETEVLKQMTGNVFSTVYFALATVFGVMITLVGFSWYQNSKVYDRDKEVMRDALSVSLNAHFAELEKRLSQRIGERGEAFEAIKKKFGALDAKIAEVSALAIKRADDLTLSMTTDLVRTTHHPPTPRADFGQFLKILRQMSHRVSAPVLHSALILTIYTMENNPVIVTEHRVALIDLSNHLPEERQAFAARIKALAG